MEGCPENNTVLYLILASMTVPILFVCYKGVKALFNKAKGAKAMTSRRESMKTYEFAELQLELFGQKALRNLKHIGSVANLEKLAGSLYSIEKNSEIGAEIDADEEKKSECSV